MEVVCSALAGIAARLVCHPLDTVKTATFTGFSGWGDVKALAAARFSVEKKSLLSVVRFIWRCEGPLAFYRGVGVAVAGSGPGVALYLTTYTWSNGYIQRFIEANPSSVVSTIPPSFFHLLCGFLAEAVSCVFWVPVDVTKERLQVQSSLQEGRYKGNWDAVCTIARYEGIRGLYKGYWSTLASFGPYSAVYFACYETFSKLFSEHTSLGSFSTALCAGGVGNVVASIATNPLELVKTRLQVQRAVLSVNGMPTTVHGFPFCYAGLCDGLRTIVREEGAHALWRGLLFRIIYAAPNAALTMGFYSHFKTLLT